MTRAAAILLLAACNAPPPSLKIAFAGPPSQECPSTACADVPMMCPSVMSIRIIDPSVRETDPDYVLLSQCAEMLPNRHKDMCVVASVELAPKLLPVRDLEVQIALYPTTAILVDPNLSPDMNLVCPTTTRYSAATGFPVEQVPTPALGGHSYYHPGDQTVTVTLGCTDLNAINASCAGANIVQVAASLENFKDRFPVTDVSVVEQLEVSAGEPRAFNNAFELNSKDTSSLALTINGNGRPTWGGEVMSPLTRFACLRVRDDAAQSTATVTCKPMIADQPLDLVGELLAKEQLDGLLHALVLPEFPPQGLTVGIVVDKVGDPIAGAVVTAKQHGVLYQATATAISGAVTSPLGVFVSTDAPFGTEFTTEVTLDGEDQTLSGIGGLIEGMVTIVILRPAAPQL